MRPTATNPPAGTATAAPTPASSACAPTPSIPDATLIAWGDWYYAQLVAWTRATYGRYYPSTDVGNEVPHPTSNTYQMFLYTSPADALNITEQMVMSVYGCPVGGNPTCFWTRAHDSNQGLEFAQIQATYCTRPWTPMSGPYGSYP